MNIVFLREHNRVAGILAAENPDWDDERVFQTARNILIVLLLKLVVEEYIMHIGPFDFPLEAVPLIADDERWDRTNWCAIEFNLLYRWHSLVPDTIGSGPGALDATDFRNNNPLVLEQGIEAIMAMCSTGARGQDRPAEHPGLPGRQLQPGLAVRRTGHRGPDAPGAGCARLTTTARRTGSRG